MITREPPAAAMRADAGVGGAGGNAPERLAEAVRAANAPGADAFVRREHRKGWSL